MQEAQLEGTQPPDGDRVPTFKDVGMLVLKYLGMLLAVGVVWGLAMATVRGTAQERSMNVLQEPLLMFLAEGALLLTLLISGRSVRVPLWSWRELRSPRVLLLAGVGLSFAAVVVTVPLLNDPLTKMTSLPHMWKLVLEIGDTAFSWLELLLRVVAVCLFAPLAEEWFFRGLLQPVLMRRWGAVAGIAVTVLLFNLLHPWNLASQLAVGAMAVVLGVTAARRNTLTYCVLLHAVYNLAMTFPLLWRSLSHLL